MSLPEYPIPRGAVTECMKDPELHFPDRNAPVKTERAKKVCEGCPYIVGCLEWALAHGEEGVWAGTDEKDRRRICNARSIVPVRPLFDLPRGNRNLIPHGTPVGVEAHKKRYQPLCDECASFAEGRHVSTGRVRCMDCGARLMPASMTKHKRLHCAGRARVAS